METYAETYIFLLLNDSLLSTAASSSDASRFFYLTPSSTCSPLSRIIHPREADADGKLGIKKKEGWRRNWEMLGEERFFEREERKGADERGDATVMRDEMQVARGGVGVGGAGVDGWRTAL